MNEKSNKQELSAREHAFQEWFVSEVQAGIREADAGDFATDEEVAAMHAKWSKQNISAQERLKRMRAVEEAHASMALSGEPVSEEEKKHADRYINGELTLKEFLAVGTRQDTPARIREALERSLEDIEDVYLAETALERFRASGEEAIPLEEVIKRYNME